MTWLTPKRLRAATLMLFVAAFAVSSFGLSGSSTAATQHTNGVHSAAR